MPEPKSIEDALVLLQERPNDAELYQQLGRLYLNHQDVRSALDSYMESMRLNPDDPFTYLFVGSILELCGENRAALEFFNYAVRLSPFLPVVHWCRGDLFKSAGAYDLAEEAYEMAVDVDPDNQQAAEKLSEWHQFLNSSWRDYRESRPD